MMTEIVKIENTGYGMAAALNAVEKLAEDVKLTKKEGLRLRLLAEEMMGMIRGIVGRFGAEFWAEENGREMQLCLKADAHIDLEQRNQLLAVSSSGKNQAEKSFMGKVRGIFELYLMNYEADWQYMDLNSYPMYYYGDAGSMGMSMGYERMWSLKSMRNDLDNSKNNNAGAEEEWDELEKSIVGKLADEVLVGVRSRKVELIIKKKF